MTTWAELLRSKLDLPFWTPGDDPVPFGLPPVPGDAWQVAGLEEADGRWRLRAQTVGGLEATMFFEFFPDTRAVECWGEIVNAGSTSIAGVTGSLTLDTPLRLSPEFAQPWVRSINGVGPDVKNHFPPRDFASLDRQILGPQMWVSDLTLSTSPTSRTSADYVPVAILGNGPGTAGLAFMLEWAGMWRISFKQGGVDLSKMPWDRDLDPPLRVQIGIDELLLDLEPGETLPLPRLLIAAFDGDLDAGGNAIRRHLRRHVMPQLGGEEVLPPTSFNHWFAFANEYTADSMKAEVDASVAAGLEYFCIDGGWFRGDFPNGVGNWDEGDPAKFPDGIKPFADYVTSQGLKYGTWFEPERATLDSDLYREHPDWFWITPPSEGRKFYYSGSALMNFGLPEVRAWWVERIVRAYDEWGVRWIRWDFNIDPRPNWEHDVPAGKIGWRQIDHVLGLYATLDEIIAARPELFIEQCASGGFRIEMGLVRRGHSFWMNDVTEQTDVVRAFQHGLNQILPGNYANTNICQPRHDFTAYDFLSHSVGGYGYSGRLSQAPEADFERYAQSVADFKGFRHLLLGDYSRPTGQAARRDEYAKVVFSDGGESVAIEFNHDGPGTARFNHTGGGR